MADVSKNKNILWISLTSRARGSPSRPTDRIMCLIWRKDFMFSAVVTWDFQVGCTEEMSSFCPKGRSTSITCKYLHFFQPYANKTVITDSFMVRFVASVWLEHWTADLTWISLSFYFHHSHIWDGDYSASLHPGVRLWRMEAPSQPKGIAVILSKSLWQSHQDGEKLSAYSLAFPILSGNWKGCQVRVTLMDLYCQTSAWQWNPAVKKLVLAQQSHGKTSVLIKL